MILSVIIWLFITDCQAKDIFKAMQQCAFQTNLGQVCGSNGVTYKSVCAITAFQEIDPYLYIQHYGPCKRLCPQSGPCNQGSCPNGACELLPCNNGNCDPSLPCKNGNCKPTKRPKRITQTPRPTKRPPKPRPCSNDKCPPCDSDNCNPFEPPIRRTRSTRPPRTTRPSRKTRPPRPTRRTTRSPSCPNDKCQPCDSDTCDPFEPPTRRTRSTRPPRTTRRPRPTRRTTRRPLCPNDKCRATQRPLPCESDACMLPTRPPRPPPTMRPPCDNGRCDLPPRPCFNDKCNHESKPECNPYCRSQHCINICQQTRCRPDYIWDVNLHECIHRNEMLGTMEQAQLLSYKGKKIKKHKPRHRKKLKKKSQKVFLGPLRGNTADYYDSNKKYNYELSLSLY